MVNTNLASLQGQRSLALTSRSLQGTFERLSTGLRINRAADDAAGLGVSENMDADLRASRQAIRNTNDGISLIQVAEGASNEVANMLKRMKELLVQASSETLGSIERGYISEEVYTLRREIDRVAQTTEWQGTNLLTAGQSMGTSTTGLSVGQTIGPSSIVYSNGLGFWGGGYADSSHPTATMGAATVSGFASPNTPGSGAAGAYSIQVDMPNNRLRVTDPNGVISSWVTAFTDSSGSFGPDGFNIKIEFDNNIDIQLNSSNSAFTFNEMLAGINGSAPLQSFTFGNMDFRQTITSLSVNAIAGTYTFGMDQNNNLLTLTGPGGTDAIDMLALADYTTDEGGVYAPGTQLALNFDGLGISLGVDPGASYSMSYIPMALLGGMFGSPFSFQVDAGAGAVDTGVDVQVGAGNGQKIVLQTANLTADGLGLTAISSSSAISSANVARAQLSVIDTALQSVGSFRSDLGAQQNRLESTQRNLTTYTENLSAAKSRILDADFAYETAQLAKFQILQQSGVAVLGQANSMNQAALRLLG